MRLEREKFEAIEAGKDRRARMSADRPRGATAEARPQRMEFVKVKTEDGRTEVHGLDPVTGELKTINGKPVSGGSADSKPKSSYSQLWD
jgi:hypothetical protein